MLLSALKRSGLESGRSRKGDQVGKKRTGAWGTCDLACLNRAVPFGFIGSSYPRERNACHGARQCVKEGNLVILRNGQHLGLPQTK